MYAEKRYRDAIATFVAHAQENQAEAAEALVGAAKAALVVEPRSAERFLRAALASNPNHFLALRSLAQCLPESSAERRELLERATTLRPDIISLLLLGDYYRTILKDYERACATYRRAVEAQPRDPTGYTKLADIYRRTGDVANERLWRERLREQRQEGRAPRRRTMR
jgi:tetratricopeptide (TPR) repeat protein